MHVSELRKLPAKELEGKAQEIREKLFHLGFKGVDEGTKASDVRELRKDIARIHGLLAAQQAEGKPKREKMSRAERVARNLRKACLACEAKKAAEAAKAAPKAKKQGGNKGKAKTAAPAKAPASKAPVAEKKA
jgi:ribosomal protein L29